MKQVGRRPVASGQAMKLQQLRGQSTVAADDRTALIDALAQFDRTDPAVQAILAVAHSVFSYGSLTHMHWAALLSRAMGLDHTTIGLSARTAARLTRELDRGNIHAGQDLLDRLDALAAKPGPDGSPSAADQYAAARKARVEEAAQRKAEIMRSRAAKAEAFKSGQASTAVDVAVNRTTLTVDLPPGFNGSLEHKRQLIAAVEKRSGRRVTAVRTAQGQPDKLQVEVE